jgi:uncharacterized protein (DUF305 family)
VRPRSTTIAFAQQMIPHHSQAVEMAKLVPSRTGNAKIIDVADRVQKAQDPEIQLMTGWLTSWGAGMSMPGDHAMPGMMSDPDMGKLQGAQGAEFDRMWLRMMIQHHQGAIDMARVELAQGSDTDARTLAQKIIDAQQAEITEMNGLLGQS